ncbi:hypothetical protein AVDCRST_MAG82-1064, partial [uncultured Rubrobacteraceae bacterium]
ARGATQEVRLRRRAPVRGSEPADACGGHTRVAREGPRDHRGVGKGARHRQGARGRGGEGEAAGKAGSPLL